MQVSRVTSNRIITPKTTGYAATTALGVAVYSGITKNRSIRKTHKPFAYISAVLTAIHIALIEYNHWKWKHSSTKNS